MRADRLAGVSEQTTFSSATVSDCLRLLPTAQWSRGCQAGQGIQVYVHSAQLVGSLRPPASLGRPSEVASCCAAQLQRRAIRRKLAAITVYPQHLLVIIIIGNDMSPFYHENCGIIKGVDDSWHGKD